MATLDFPSLWSFRILSLLLPASCTKLISISCITVSFGFSARVGVAFSLTSLITPDIFGFVLAAACAGWGGLSVLCQTAAVLDGTGLRLASCVWGKILQALLSAALALALSGYVLS